MLTWPAGAADCQACQPVTVRVVLSFWIFASAAPAGHFSRAAKMCSGANASADALNDFRYSGVVGQMRAGGNRSYAGVRVRLALRPCCPEDGAPARLWSPILRMRR